MPKNRFNFVHFVEAANAMANSIRDKRECLFALCFSHRRPSLDFPTKPLLVFKSTGGKRPRGHVADTECRPDITAAFDKNWGKTVLHCGHASGSPVKMHLKESPEATRRNKQFRTSS